MPNVAGDDGPEEILNWRGSPGYWRGSYFAGGEGNLRGRAAVAFVAFGPVWLSVRGQHPYKGPTAVGLVGLYVAVLIRIATVLYAHRRATAGVTGRSVRRRQAEGGALAVAIMLVAGASAFAGPRGVWLGDALGLGVVLLGTARSRARCWTRLDPAHDC